MSTLRRPSPFVPTILPALAVAALGVLAVPALAHDSAAFMAGKQARAPGSVVVVPGDPSGFRSQGVSLLAWLPLSEFGSTGGADCWGYTSPSGRDYAIMTTDVAISFVDITDPGVPQIVQTFSAVTSSWRDVKIYQTYAYWVSEGGDGIQVADLSQIDSGVVTYVGGFNGQGTSASHNVAIDEDAGFLYRLGGGSSPTEGLRIYSLANPASPSYVSSWSNRYIHDAQIVTYTSGPFSGQQVAFCYSETSSGGGTPGLDILDVTNKGNISTISSAFYGSAVYSHQGWLSPDRSTLYLNDELDEQSFGTPTTTRVLDVSNLNSPQVLGSFTTGLDAIDHNLYTKDNLIFEANYRSGLRVLDATNQTSPVETAWFDTYPGDDDAQFNGLWSVYPYYDSGTVIGSDIERGLFVWRLGDRELEFDIANGVPALFDPDGEQMIVRVKAPTGAGLRGQSVRLHVDTGSGFVEEQAIALGGGRFRLSFPPIACGTSFTWYVSAQTRSGTTWTEPAAGPSYVFGGVAAEAENTLVLQELETQNAAWIAGVGTDTATTGIWERVDPVGTSAAPEDDHTPSGTMCYVTGQGVALGSVGANDVDGGQTTLMTPNYDLSSGDATISYWRWYSNSVGVVDDVFIVDISNDDGNSWTNVEVIGPTGDEIFGGWFEKSFLVSDFVAPTSTVRLRFIADDSGSGSIVEAAIDDVRVVRYSCGERGFDTAIAGGTPAGGRLGKADGGLLDGTTFTDLGNGGPGEVALTGRTAGDGSSAVLRIEGAAPNAPALLVAGTLNDPVPFLGGRLVPGSSAVHLVQLTDASGRVEFALPGDTGAGTFYAQIVVVDEREPFGVALSNAVELVFE